MKNAFSNLKLKPSLQTLPVRLVPLITAFVRIECGRRALLVLKKSVD